MYVWQRLTVHCVHHVHLDSMMHLLLAHMVMRETCGGS